MMKTTLRVAAGMLFLQLTPSAQLALAQGYVNGGIHFPKQDAAPPPTGPYAVAPAGRTTGWNAGGGVYLNRAIAIDGAWARTGVMRSVQMPRGDQLALDLRDNFISIGVRGRLPEAPHLTIEPVAGFLVLVREDWSQQVQGGYPRRKSVETGYGVSFGMDARIGSRRIGLVPTLRVYSTNAEGSNSPYPGGARHLTIAPGVGIQVNF
jgi:hypothetical protein